MASCSRSDATAPAQAGSGETSMDERQPEPARAPGAALLPLALRDLALVAAALALWAADARVRGDGGALATPLAVATGGLTALAGYLAHEWGHLTGAWLGGSIVHPAASPASVFLFRFDVDRNDRRQFAWMSLGGFAATAVVVALLLIVLPRDALAGQVALGLTAAGVLATAALELPPFFRVLAGGPLPRGAAYVADEVAIRDADLADPAHADALVALIDDYARGPGGQQAPLSAEARAHMAAGLRALPTAFVLLAFAGERAVGAAVCTWGFSTFTGRPSVNVHDLAVAPAFQRRGIGTRLLAEVERRARAHGAARLTLEVRETNEAAIRLYRRAGFGPWEAPRRTLFVAKPLAGERAPD
jgi:ribosomal protein S18 acetylase RimI-like enzyme